MKKQLISYTILVAILSAAVALLLFLREPHDINWMAFYTIVAIPSVCSMAIMLRFVGSPVLAAYQEQVSRLTYRFRVVFIPLSIVLIFFQLLLLTGCYSAITSRRYTEVFLFYGFFLMVALVSIIYFLYHLTEPAYKLRSLEDDAPLTDRGKEEFYKK